MLEHRFTSKFEVAENGCWLWHAAKDRKGYGVYAIPRAEWLGPGFTRNRAAHRYAYEAIVGPISEGLVIDHICRVHNCVNPEHLQPVTHLENVRRGAGVGMALWDGVSHGPSSVARKTHCKHGHEYTPENTYYVDGGAHRKCRTCVLGRMMDRYWRTTQHVYRPRGDYMQCIRGHEMTPENTYDSPDGRRRCRRCLAEDQRAYQRRKRGR